MNNKELTSKIQNQLIHLNFKHFFKWAADMHRHFSKEDIQVANRHMKRCSASLIIREMWIESAMKWQLTPVRMPVIQNSTSDECWWVWGKENPYTLWVGMRPGTVTVEDTMESPQRTKNKTTIRSNNSTPDCVSKGNENINWKIHVSHIHSSTICNSTTAKIYNQPKCPLTDK